MATTIQLDESTKDRLDKVKLDNESYDTAVNRLLDDQPDGLLSETEVREIARDEIRNELESYGRR